MAWRRWWPGGPAAPAGNRISILPGAQRRKRAGHRGGACLPVSLGSRPSGPVQWVTALEQEPCRHVGPPCGSRACRLPLPAQANGLPPCSRKSFSLAWFRPAARLRAAMPAMPGAGWANEAPATAGSSAQMSRTGCSAACRRALATTRGKGLNDGRADRSCWSPCAMHDFRLAAWRRHRCPCRAARLACREVEQRRNQQGADQACPHQRMGAPDAAVAGMPVFP